MDGKKRLAELPKVSSPSEFEPRRRLANCQPHTCSAVARRPRRSSTCAPGALDTLAAALPGDAGKPRFVTGEARAVGGRLVIDPQYVVADRLLVLNLEPPRAHPPLPLVRAGVAAPLLELWRSAHGVLEEVVPRGLREIGTATLGRAHAAAEDLDKGGLTATADALTRFASAASDALRDGGMPAFDVAADAFLQVGLLLDLASEALQ